MPSYTLELELYSALNTTTSDFQIWADGSLFGSGYTVSSSGTTVSVSIPYSGSLPTSLEFRFNDLVPASVDQIEIRSVKINDRYVNNGNYLSSMLLNNGGSSTVNIANADYIFNISAEPVASEFTTGATKTFTAGIDFNNAYAGITNEIFNTLGGADYVHTGSGNDKIAGGAGDDVMRGGAGNDLIFGEGDNDTLYGMDGNDRIYGGTENDKLYGDDGDDAVHGGAGNDVVNGGAGNDTMTGGAGDDILNGGTGDDVVYGDAGVDQLTGGAGTDTLDGGAGDDFLQGGADNDILNGGTGNDTAYGGLGNDTVHGDAGDDVLYGDTGDDVVYGGADNDYLHGNDGTDTLHGDAGADILVGGLGADILNGGSGNDILHGHGLNFNTIYTTLKNNAGVVYNAETNSFYQYVNTAVSYATALSTAQAASLNGVAGHLATITSATENAYVTSLISGTTWLSGTDSVVSGEWRWVGGVEDGIQYSDISGNVQNNLYENWDVGQPQDNTEHNAVIHTTGLWHDYDTTVFHRYVIEWDAGLMNDDSAVDTLNGGAGNDTLYGHGGDDVLNGDADNDVLFAGAGNDTLNGGTGNDALYGEAGTDTLNGGTGNDSLYGGSGIDTLYGDDGDDELQGGDGADILYAHTAGSLTSGISPFAVTPVNVAYAAGADGFVYADDTFGSTGQPNNRVSGSHITTDGHAANGALEVYFNGGSGGNARTNMSGSYNYTFSVTNYTLAASMTFWYRAIGQNLDAGEVLSVRTNFDNNVNIISTMGTGTYDTGWVSSTVYLGNLTTGSHTIRIGGLLLGANQTGEDAYIRIDDVVITGTDNGQEASYVATSGGTTTNTLYGDAGADTLYGSAGTDMLYGGADNDIVYGGEGNDTLYGEAGADSLYGDAGNDIIFGGAGNDTLYGGAGNDVLIGGDDVDTLYGGAGNDYIGSIQGTSITVTSLLSYGGAQDVGGTITYFDGGFTMDGNLWKKVALSYTVTANTILEFDFRSTVQGEVHGIGFDTDNNIDTTRTFQVYGTQNWGITTYYNYSGTDWVHYRVDVGAHFTGTFTHLVFAGDDDAAPLGNGSWANIRIYEKNTADTTADILYGGAGNDTITGNAGVNTIYAGDGLDELYGHGGADTFVFERAYAFNNIDNVRDFRTAENDKLNLRDLLTGYDFGVDTLTNFVQITTSGANSNVYVDVTGSASFGAGTQVAVLYGITGLTNEVALETSGHLITH